MKKDNRNRPLLSLYRLLTALSLVVYLGAMVLIWNLTITESRSTLNHVNSMLVQGVRTTLNSHELVLRGLGEELIAMGTLEVPERGRALIERMNNIDPGMIGFGLARADGQLVLVSSIQQGEALPNIATRAETRDSYLEALQAGRLRTGRPYFFEQLGGWVVAIRVPLYDADNRLQAVMAAGYNIEGGTTAWANMQLPPDVSVALAGEDRYLRYVHPLRRFNQSGSTRLYSEPIEDSFVAWAKGFSADLALDLNALPFFGGAKYLAYKHIPEYGLHAVTFIQQSRIFIGWLQRMLVPSLLFATFILVSFLAYRQAAKRQDQSDAALSELGAWQRAVLDAAGYGIISTDTEGNIISFNRMAQRMLGYRADEILNRANAENFHLAEELQERAGQLERKLQRHAPAGFRVVTRQALEGRTEIREWTYVRQDGSQFPVRLSVSPLRGERDEVIGFLCLAEDLTEAHAIQADLRDIEARYTALFRHAGDAILLMHDGRFVDCNPATLHMLRCTRAQVIGTQPAEYSARHSPDGPPPEEATRRFDAAFNGEYQFFEWPLLRHDGSVFDAEISLSMVEIAHQPHILTMVRDITERKRAEKELAYQARYDSLTGLPNRANLHLQFKKALQSPLPVGHRLFLLLLDLNRFKEINDTLGHHFGDEVLAKVGARLKQACREASALVARLGGDEFAIMLSGNAADGAAFARALVDSLKHPFAVGGLEISVGASVGIAEYPQHGEDSHALLRAADVAMYQAKQRGLGVCLYDVRFDDYSTERLALVSELNDALQRRELVLFYQPKVDIATGEPVGFEALARWQHPRLGLLDPADFIDLVEMSEIVHPFTHEVLRLAIAGNQYLQRHGWQLPVAINLSPRNLQDSQFFSDLQATLEAHAIAPAGIEIEITETALMLEPEHAIEVLGRLNALGVKIAIDDFGTGYSSLRRLRYLPVQSLKIDRSFVTEMTTNEADRAIVRSTVALAHSLNLKVVAEGVEDAQTLQLLGDIGCDQAQGYGLGKPLALEQAVHWLRRNAA